LVDLNNNRITFIFVFFFFVEHPYIQAADSTFSGDHQFLQSFASCETLAGEY
jgi:hypothetical protein